LEFGRNNITLISLGTWLSADQTSRIGGAEFAGQENDGQSCRVENAGLEIDGQVQPVKM